MMTDALSIVTNSNWQTEQVGYHYTRVIPPDAKGIGRIWEMKDKSGWPADVNLFDDKFIYLTFTEADAPHRNDPSCYKYNLGLNGMGWPAIPRYFTQLPWTNEVFGKRVGDSQYSIYQNCKFVGQKGLGTMRFVFDGPFRMSWLGDLEDCPTYVLNYFYNSGKSRERFFYALRPDGTSYGWIGWDVAQDGVIGPTSYRNTIVKVAPPVPANPCKL